MVKLLDMDVFLNLSHYWPKKNPSEFQLLCKSIERLGHKIVNKNLISRDIDDLISASTEDQRNDYRDILTKLAVVDVVIYEATSPSVGTGHLYTKAIEFHLPILVLSKSIPHMIFIAETSRLVTIKTYNPEQKTELNSILEAFFSAAREKVYNRRFNLMISDEQYRYLLSCGTLNNTSLASYLRNLIEMDMSTNKSV